MFSPIAIRVIEEAHGKASAVLLEEIPGVSAKAWREGGPKSPVVVRKIFRHPFADRA